METNRQTKLIYQNHAIHTRYFGSITKDDVLEAIAEWVELLNVVSTIRFVIFDYTKANMSLLNANDVRDVAVDSEQLVNVRPNIKMMGVMPNQSDYLLTSVWSGFSTMDHTPIDYSNIVICRDLHEAKYLIENMKG